MIKLKKNLWISSIARIYYFEITKYEYNSKADKRNIIKC